MRPWIRRTLAVTGIIIAVAVTAAGWYLTQAIPIGTGYVAKYICSGVFVSGRDPDAVFREDVAPVNPLAAVISVDIDRINKRVKADSFGLFKATAVYREGCGCTLAVGLSEEDLRRQDIAAAAQKKLLPDDLPWPAGNGEIARPLPAGIDEGKLSKALDNAFAESGSKKLKYTRAVLVVYDGRLIAERYAPGFDRNMPLLGWSISKSITNALVGIMVKNGKLRINAPAPVPEWQKEGDPRGKITLDQLLRMSSGLEFEEIYKPLYDATKMLYGSSDFAAYAAAKPLEAAPDAKWSYSGGTANIISRIVRTEAEKSYRNCFTFMREELFDRIGMLSAVPEPDPSGTYVGSSYTFATPRDWARFGQLYLQDGVWNGERILPEGWIAYTTTPTSGAPIGEYGALFWLNVGQASDHGKRRWPSSPADAYSADGFQEQKVIIIPSKKLVLVRFGATTFRKAWNTDVFIADVLAALP
ncbi:MAG: class C beta-lactamase-related serine hydrolase [Desulfobacteraceae bacterium]|nr:MAG: class C beta-lactamase-related serine hydrolase [Desulfobacteraceae bacterium]